MMVDGERENEPQIKLRETPQTTTRPGQTSRLSHSNLRNSLLLFRISPAKFPVSF